MLFQLLFCLFSLSLSTCVSSLYVDITIVFVKHFSHYTCTCFLLIMCDIWINPSIILIPLWFMYFLSFCFVLFYTFYRFFGVFPRRSCLILPSLGLMTHLRVSFLISFVELSCWPAGRHLLEFLFPLSFFR